MGGGGRGVLRGGARGRAIRQVMAREIEYTIAPDAEPILKRLAFGLAAYTGRFDKIRTHNRQTEVWCDNEGQVSG